MSTFISGIYHPYILVKNLFTFFWELRIWIIWYCHPPFLPQERIVHCFPEKLRFLWLDNLFLSCLWDLEHNCLFRLPLWVFTFNTCHLLLNLVLSSFQRSKLMFFLCLQRHNQVSVAKTKPKTNFVEARTFWHLFRSFDRMWIFFIMAFQVP